MTHAERVYGYDYMNDSMRAYQTTAVYRIIPGINQRFAPSSSPGSSFSCSYTSDRRDRLLASGTILIRQSTTGEEIPVEEWPPITEMYRGLPCGVWSSLPYRRSALGGTLISTHCPPCSKQPRIKPAPIYMIFVRHLDTPHLHPRISVLAGSSPHPHA